MDYVSALENKNFVPNIIIQLMGEYFSIRQPNSGLVIDSDKVGIVAGLTVNPTSLDPFFPSTTISSYSFKLQDTGNVISSLLAGLDSYFVGEEVNVWIGRYGLTPETEMAFSEYLQLPKVFVKKVSKPDQHWTFQAVEARDRLSTGAFNVQKKLGVDILVGTTIITMADVTGLPTSGMIKIEDEFISYTGISVLNLTGCIRGERSSTPAEHALGSDVFLVQEIQDNGINILLQLLISSGGGGVYDTLSDGAAIDQTLIDIDQFETVRDEFFSTFELDFAIYGVDSLKEFIETELFALLGIRLRSNNNGKIGVALINRNFMVIDAPILNEDNLVKNPDMKVDDTKIKNQIRIQWDYSETLDQYLESSEYTDPTSIAAYGPSDWATLKFKGVKSSLGGQDIVDDIGMLFLNRFKQPRPEIKVDTLINATYLNLGDKVDLESTSIPNSDGELDFASTLEVVQRSINYETGDVSFQLQFTAFTGVRQCYIAPSDTIASKTSQSIIGLGAGRGDVWRKGWICRLWNNVTHDYEGTEENEILSVSGDTITFVAAWVTVITTATHRLKFADYNKVNDQQKRFCFISDNGADFSDGKKSYAISYG